MAENVRISQTVVEAAEPTPATYILWDSELPGFGLRITPAGAKAYVVFYRAEGGGRRAPKRLQTIGRHPALSAAKARKAATEIKAKAALGGDPAGALAEKRRQMTVSELVDLYEDEGLVVQRGARIGTPMKPLTARYTMARLRHHVVPMLGKQRVAELVQGDIEALARAVAKGRTAKDEKGEKARSRVIVRGGEGAARKVVRDFSAVLSFAQRRRIVAENVALTASVRKTDGRRERFLTGDEVQRLGQALDTLGTDDGRGRDKRGNPLPPLNPKALNIARLWALTGCRRNEVAGLQWSEVDLERGLLVFGDTKTGQSVRPLSSAASALLTALRENRTADSKYVFPAERGDGFYVGTKDVWPEVTKSAGLPGVSPHVLRHTLGAAAASGGEALLLVGAILGHANARSTQIYSHVDRDPARLAADRATAGIAKALGIASNTNQLPTPPSAANEDAA